MKNYLYTLPVTNIEHEIAHLFEHLLLRKLNSKLASAHIVPTLEVSTKGETFADVVFIHFSTPNAQAADIFETFMAHRNKIDLKDVDIELQRIEIEERAILTIRDREELSSVLKELDTRSDWKDLATAASPAQLTTHSELIDDSDIIHKRKNAHSFRDLSVGFGINDASADEIALFSVMGHIVTDALYSSLNAAGFYIYGNSLPYQEYNSASQHGIDHIIFGVKRNTESNHDVQTIVDRTSNELAESYDIEKVRTKAHEIIDRPEFLTQAMELLGIVVSTSHVKSLVTKENIDAMFNKMRFIVRPTQESDWDRV